MKIAIHSIRRLTAIVLCMVMATVLTLPLIAQAAQVKGKVVRVGWYESPVSSKDENGRRSGYDYIYEQKLAAYTGWTYEYVEGSWPELLEKLEKGEIDMMGDISYTEDRKKYLLYPSHPMGAEEYYIFVTPDNPELTQGNDTAFNGKKIGVNKNSIQERLYQEWSRKNHISAELIELSVPEAQAFTMVQNKELDALVTIDGYGDPEKAVPVCKIGSSDYYFAVTRQRPDLYEELEAALNKINEENRYFNQQMHEKYINSTGTNLYLNEEEKAWLASHGTIRVGYVDNYLPFCSRDEQSRKLTGALKEYLEYVSSVIKNGDLRFDSICFSTLEEAIDALKKGDINCVFPANISEYDAEEMGLVLTPSIISAELYEIVRMNDKNSFGHRQKIRVALNKGNVNYEKVLDEKFPQWEKVVYPNLEDCLRAVSDGAADTVLTSNFRFNNISRQCEKLDLTPITTGTGIEYSFTAAKGEPGLYSILNKTVGTVPSSKINSMMTQYIAEKERELSIAEFLLLHLAEVFAIVAAVLLVILLLSLRNIHAMKRARKSERLIASAEIDKLTGVYSKNFLFEYAGRLQKKSKGKPLDAIVVDIERFHFINSLNGLEFGDKVLSTLGEQIRTVFRGTDNIAGRIEADRFCVFRPSKNVYQELLHQLQSQMDELLPNVKIRLRMGVLPGQSRVDPEEMYDRARIACNMARSQYDKQPLVVYDDTIRDQQYYEQRLLNDLKRAVTNEEFEVYYQPQYDIQSDPPKLKSAETLVRWRHPELGTVMPGDFVPLFEKNGVIGEVDKYVWKKAARQIAAWKEQHGTVIPVSVNLSRVDIFDPNLENELDALLLDNHLEHGAIKLEITESAYTENTDQVIVIIDRLRKKGYEIELDDFGTGYSSLGALSAMPIDFLKMDRSFIINTHHNDTGVRMVRLILDFAREMKIPVIAEGVEDENELRMLKEMGCDIVQGYFFSRPLPAADFAKLLQSEQ